MTGNQTSTAGPEAAPPETPPVEAGAAPVSKRRVLIVEDNETARKQIQVFLETDPGLAVDTAANGSDALKALTERPYSVIVTDLKMPRVDGLQLLEEVQKRRLPADVIITTGFGTIEQAVQAMRLGAVDFLTKPINLEHLRLVIQRALRERALQDEVDRAAREAARAVHVPQHPEQEPADARRLRADQPRGADDQHGADLRRDRHGQGAGGPGGPRGVAAPRQPVRRGQLRGPARVAAGERAVRPREGGVHQRRRPAQGAVRAGPRRHHLPRRDRRDPAAHAGQAAPRAAGAAVRARRRRRRPSRSTSASSPPPTAICSGCARRGSSARTCTTGSTS